MKARLAKVEDVVVMPAAGNGVLTGTSQGLPRLSPPGSTGGMEQSAKRVATAAAQEQELADLMGRAAWGGQAALGTLYDKTSSLVYGLALRILRDRSAAEEVTIEVYLQAYRQASSYDSSRGNPSAWLLMLTRSRAIDRLRAESQRRTREEPLEAAAPLAPELHGCVLDDPGVHAGPLPEREPRGDRRQLRRHERTHL